MRQEMAFFLFIFFFTKSKHVRTDASSNRSMVGWLQVNQEDRKQSLKHLHSSVPGNNDNYVEVTREQEKTATDVNTKPPKLNNKSIIL